jgi:hypothetical protein
VLEPEQVPEFVTQGEANGMADGERRQRRVRAPRRAPPHRVDDGGVRADVHEHDQRARRFAERIARGGGVRGLRRGKQMNAHDQCVGPWFVASLNAAAVAPPHIDRRGRQNRLRRLPRGLRVRGVQRRVSEDAQLDSHALRPCRSSARRDHQAKCCQDCRARASVSCHRRLRVREAAKVAVRTANRQFFTVFYVGSPLRSRTARGGRSRMAAGGEASRNAI